MRIAYFTHSLASCWNHGNAHFVRGVLRELVHRGHEAIAYEPVNGWSSSNLLQECGPAPFVEFHRTFPELISVTYSPGFDPECAIEGADVVIVHEWTDPSIVGALGRLRRSGGRFTLLFHDTHHRAVSDPTAIRNLPLEDYDAVLAFGDSLADIYRRWGWDRTRVFVWHEAADTSLFRAPAEEGLRNGLVWIGNWGDGERTRDLQACLLEPASRARVPLYIFGVRYPAQVKAQIASCGGSYRGWTSNISVPAIFARHLATAHIPRRFYLDRLPGIPTIRMFEAMACGIPLLCLGWDDTEGLFRVGTDYVRVTSGDGMQRQLVELMSDASLRAELARAGLERIASRHTCGHRVDELLGIVRQLRNVEVEPRREEVA